MPPSKKLLLLGTGQVAKAVIEEFREQAVHIIASTRNPNRIFELANLGVEPLIMPMPSAEIVERIAEGADLLVSFPPDGNSDAILAPACAEAKSIVYISSTGVYGSKSGRIDDSIPVDSAEERMRPRLQAESIWREHGAVVLRAPGIYGPTNGLHKRLAEGSYKMPGDGSNTISRIHVEDLAGIIATIFQSKKLSDSTYLVADQNPSRLKDVVQWLCQQMDLQLPEGVPLTAVNPTLRGNRSIDGTRILKELGYKLKYPGFIEGYQQCLAKNRD